MLEVRAFSLDADVDCAVRPNADVRLQALGPFPATELGAEQVPFQATERTLTFPDETHGVEAQASDGNRSWFGYTDRRNENGIDVLLWADGVSCGLFESSSYPASNAGQAIGYSPEAGVVLVAGGDTTENAAGGSLVFESDTGASSLVAPSGSFPQARAYATVTPFGPGLLLAGGEDPLDADVVPSEREVRQTAIVYDPALGGFDANVIELELERTRHAAVVMAGGETLLVGGGRPRSDGSTAAVTLFEVVSPVSGRSTINGVVGLAHGRLEPAALRLDNGNLLVGGGYDPSGNPLASLEWFSPDAACPLSPREGTCTSDPPATLPVTRHHRAFVAMPGGGALTAGGCEPADAQSPACERACGTGFGCPASAPDAWWITPDGDVTEVRLAAHDDCPNLVPDRVLFATGSDGSPWLFAYDADPPCRAIFRFDPWRVVFSPAELELSRWPDPRAVLTSLGPDAFVWLTEDDPPILAGTRTSSRGVLSQYEASLLVVRDDPQVPVHLAPDRPPEASGLPVALFEPGGRLILTSADAPGESAVGVFVTDTRYDDVSVELDFDDALPVLLLGNFEVGGDGPCQWPGPAVPPLVAARRGTEVTTSDRDGNVFRCEGTPNGPVSVGVRAGVAATTLTSLVVRRL